MVADFETQDVPFQKKLVVNCQIREPLPWKQSVLKGSSILCIPYSAVNDKIMLNELSEYICKDFSLFWKSNLSLYQANFAKCSTFFQTADQHTLPAVQFSKPETHETDWHHV